MKHVALGFAALFLVAPGWLYSSASPERAAVRASVAVTDTDPKYSGQIFVHEFGVTIPVGSLSAQGAPYVVPEGKILVVEYISAAVFAQATSLGGYAFLRSSKDGVIRDFFVVMAKAGNFGPDYMVAGQVVRLYFTGGTALYPDMGRSTFTSDQVGANMTLMGRLISD